VRVGAVTVVTATILQPVTLTCGPTVVLQVDPVTCTAVLPELPCPGFAFCGFDGTPPGFFVQLPSLSTGEVLAQGAYFAEWKAFWDSPPGSSTQCTTAIFVQDLAAPVFGACPAPLLITVPGDGYCGAVVALDLLAYAAHSCS
jgi:hypothetical protein